MRVFISAGEASGDLHASRLIRELKRLDPNLQVTFLGGDLMAEEAGHAPLIHIRDMAYMGFVDVARHLPSVIGNLRKARKALAESDADLLILVDYPSFNLKLAAEAKRLGVPAVGYISPKVWAWKEGRIPKMKRLMRHIYSILPFEPDYFAGHGLTEVTYVGNPSREEVDQLLEAEPSEAFEVFCNEVGLDPKKHLLALVPGSRVGEIRSNLSIMAAVAARHPELQAVVAGAPAIAPELYRRITHLPVVYDASFRLMRHAKGALVTSGTATLECALTGTPQVACYRANGSRVAYELFKRILKVDFVTLPNLICGRRVIPEMLLHQCTVEAVDRELTLLLDEESAESAAMRQGYEELRRRLGKENAAVTAAAHIVSHYSSSVGATS